MVTEPVAQLNKLHAGAQVVRDCLLPNLSQFASADLGRGSGPAMGEGYELGTGHPDSVL